MRVSQGLASRFSGLKFRPDWEVPVTAVMKMMKSLPDQSLRTSLWCSSFGGYLCARAFRYLFVLILF